MAIGDLLFGLMGQPNPQQQIAQALGQYPGQAGSRSGPVPGPGAGAAAPGLAQQGGGGAVGDSPPQPQQPPPQPQAYTSPPDLAQAYLKLMQRQQANEGINTGLGLLAGAFSHNQADRSEMINAMSGLNEQQARSGMGGGGMGGMVELINAQRQMQMQNAMMQNLPAVAKQLNMTPEQAMVAFGSGKLGDIEASVLENQRLQASPLYKAQVGEAGARTSQAQAETEEKQLTTQQKKDLMANIPQVAKDNNISEPMAKSLIESGGFASYITEMQKFNLQQNSPLYKAQTAEAQIKAAQAANEQAQRTALLGQVPQLAQQHNMSENDVRSAITNGDWDKIISAEQEAHVRTSEARAEATQRVLGETVTKAQIALPGVQNNVQDKIDLADELLNDPNLGSITGPVGGRIPERMMTPSLANTQSKIDQLIGKTGVSAVESLKGVGRVLGTEFTEGMKSQSRLEDQHVKTDDFKSAIKDYQLAVLRDTAAAHKMAQTPLPDKLQKKLDQLEQWKSDQQKQSSGKMKIWNPEKQDFE